MQGALDIYSENKISCAHRSEGFMGWLLSIALAGVALLVYLIHENYKLSRALCCMRYCWQTMSDFAGEQLKNEDGQLSDWWIAVLEDHKALMEKFGSRILTQEELSQYEMRLINYGMKVLSGHVEVWRKRSTAQQ